MLCEQAVSISASNLDEIRLFALYQLCQEVNGFVKELNTFSKYVELNV